MLDFFFVGDEYVMQTDNIITYDFLVKEALQEYGNIAESKWWEPTDGKNTSKDEPILMMTSNTAIKSPVNKTVEKFYCKNCHKGEYNKYGVDSHTKSVVTCHECDDNGHL